jgi:hypothetical protein
MKKIVFACALALAAMTTSSCGPGFRLGGQPWYDVYGSRCGTGDPGPGCNFYRNGDKIQAYEDPYFYDPSWGWDASVSFGLWEYYDSYGFYSVYVGWAWLSPDGVLFDEWGYALNEGERAESKDLASEYASKETAAIKDAGKNLSTRYALAEDVGMKIAKTLNNWAVLGKKRARTLDDVKALTRNLYGIELGRAESTLKDAAMSKDLRALAELNSEVATYWGTTPETSKAILTKWYRRQIEGSGF